MREIKGSLIWRLLSRADEAWSLAFSPNGKLLAIGYHDGLIQIFDIEQRSNLAVLTKFRGNVVKMRFSDDGHKLAAAMWEWKACVWDFDKEDIIEIQRAEGGNALAFSPDGKELAVAHGQFPRIDIYNTDNAELKYSLRGHKRSIVPNSFGDYINALCYSPDGKYLVSGADDATIIEWDIASKMSKMILEGHAYIVLNIVFSPSGKNFASGGGESYSYNKMTTVRIWDVRDGEQLNCAELTQNAAVDSLAYSKDGSNILIALSDGTIWKWPGEDKALKIADGFGHREKAIEFSKDGTRLAVSKRDNSIEIWDISDFLE
jgi:tricorn protease-like protein